MDILEGFFHPETPGPRNAHHSPHSPGPKGPSGFPYTEVEETMSDEEIGKELKLELKLGNVMKDPLNLPNHNAHNGSFSWGKASKPFGNYQMSGKNGPDKSQVDVLVRPIEEEYAMHDPETEERARKDLEREIIDISSRTSPELDAATKKAIETRDSARKEAAASRKKRNMPASKWESAKPSVKRLEEDIGMREKGRAYGSPITTKQPFESGVPNNTGSDFMDEDEIMKELGLMEWISSSPVFNRKIHGPEAEMNFFNDNRPAFTLNTEEEFNQNQKKIAKVNNAKTQKRKKKSI